MNGKIDLVNFTMELRVLTPVHIGNSEKYAKTDFVYDPTTRKAGLLDQNKWIRWLSSRNLLEAYTNSLASKGKHFDNFGWLRSNNIDDPFTACSGVFQTINKINVDANTLNEISKQVKDVYLRPYIPGSSLKGVIRTAVLADMIVNARLENSPKARAIDQLWENLRLELMRPGTRRNQLNSIVKDTEKKLMRILFNEMFDANGKELARMLADPFRGIRVSDTEAFAKDATTIVKKHDMVVPQGKNAVSELSLWRESIRESAKTQFTITLDVPHLEASGLGHIKDAQSLINCLKTHRKNVLDSHEKRLTSMINADNRSGMYDYRVKSGIVGYQAITLGGGTGFQSKSLIYALAPDADSANNLVKNILDILFLKPFHDHKTKDKYASPRTIKTTWIDEKDRSKSGRYKLGLCALKLTE